MSEKRGYPNPNYTEEDIMEGLPLEVNAEVMIDDEEYRELVSKAAAFDIITAEIKSKIDYDNCSNYALVDDDFILQVTGMAAYKRRKEWEKAQKNVTAANEEEPKNE